MYTALPLRFQPRSRILAWRQAKIDRIRKLEEKAKEAKLDLKKYDDEIRRRLYQLPKERS